MKQKLNTCSSTKSELVVVDQMMPAISWTRSVEEAAALADEKKKLVFVIHVFGGTNIFVLLVKVAKGGR